MLLIFHVSKMKWKFGLNKLANRSILVWLITCTAIGLEVYWQCQHCQWCTVCFNKHPHMGRKDLFVVRLTELPMELSNLTPKFNSYCQKHKTSTSQYSLHRYCLAFTLEAFIHDCFFSLFVMIKSSDCQYYQYH